MQPVSFRHVHGHVVDFIQVRYGGAYFPSFNVADSATTFGAGLLIIDELITYVFCGIKKAPRIFERSNRMQP